MIVCISFFLCSSYSYSQTTVSDNFGETDVFGMNWSAEVVSGGTLQSCCDDLVIEFTFKPELPLSGPVDPYAELRYFYGDPNDLELEDCSLVFDASVQGYKVIVDKAYVSSELENGVFTAKVTERRTAYGSFLGFLDFSVLHGVDDNGQLDGLSPMDQLSINTQGPSICEEDFDVQDLIDEGVILDPNDPQLSNLGISNFGTFTVEQDVTLGTSIDDIEVSLGEGCEIIVKDGVTLEILGTDFVACNKMWKGLHVEEGGHVIMENSTLTGAEYGIEFERGAELTLESNNFRNNFVHLKGIPDNSVSINPTNTIFHTFSNNLFTSEDNGRYDGSGVLPAPYSGQTTSIEAGPFAGMVLGDNNLLTGNCGPISLLFQFDSNGRFRGGNVFDRLANGILNRNDGSSLILQGCKFSKINSNFAAGYAEAGYGIRHDAFISSLQIQKTPNWPNPSSPNTFENVDIGVFSSISSILSIEGQVMDTVRLGIQSSRTVLGLKIDDNEISSTETAINVANTNLNRGFPFLITTDFSISDNVVSMTEENDNGSPVGIGGIILSNVIGAKGSRVNDNSIQVDYGENGLTLLSVENMQVKENTISDDGNVNTFTALHAAGGMNLFISCNQLSSQYTGTSGQSGDTHGLRIGNVVQSVINCNVISDAERGIRVFGNCSGTQIRGNTLDEHLMGVEYGYNTPLANYANTGRQEYNGNRWLSSYDPVQGEFGAKHNDGNQYELSRFIVNDTEGAVFTTVSSPSDFVEEFDAESNYTCASFSSCGSSSGLVATGWEALDSLAMKHDSIGSDDLLLEQFRDLQWQVYRRMQEGNLNNNSSFASTASNLGLTALYQDRQNLLDIILLDTLESVSFGQVDLDTVGQDYLWAVDQELLDWYEIMQTDLDQWSTAGSENIFMNTLSNGFSTLQSIWEGKAPYADSAVLDECIPYGGQGWYLVNSLLLPEDRNLGFDLNCADYRFSEVEEQVSTFSVYPNPSSGQLSIEGTSKLNTNQYRMFNSNGQLMQEGTFTDGESIRLNAEVQAGMYYIIVGEAVQKISVVR